MIRGSKVLTWLVVLFISGGAARHSNENAHDDTTRVSVVTRWIDSADNLARKTKDSRVTQIVEHIKRNFVIARPSFGEDLNILAESGHIGDGARSFAIVPLYPEDMGFPVVTRQGISSTGEYIPETKTLWLKSQGISDTFMGIILIHEGDHIMTAQERHVSYKPQVAWCVGEFTAFTTGSRVLRALGGKRYETLIAEDVKKMAAEYRNTGRFRLRMEYDSRYNKVFGLPISEQEKNARALAIIMHRVSLAIQEVVPKDAYYKVNVIASFCSYYAHLTETPFDKTLFTK